MSDFNNVYSNSDNDKYMITGIDILYGISVVVLVLLIAHFEAVL